MSSVNKRKASGCDVVGFPSVDAELIMDDEEIDEEKQHKIDKATTAEKKKKRSGGGFQSMGKVCYFTFINLIFLFILYFYFFFTFICYVFKLEEHFYDACELNYCFKNMLLLKNLQDFQRMFIVPFYARVIRYPPRFSVSQSHTFLLVKISLRWRELEVVKRLVSYYPFWSG